MRTQNIFLALVCSTALAFLSGCSKDQSLTDAQLTANTLDDRAAQVTVYPLESVSDPDISGTVTFRKAGARTLVTIALDGTTAGGDHPAHIHHNSVAEGGGIAYPLTNVRGASGRSVTMVDAAYEDLIEFDGHVNVHLSMQQLSVYIAQGNIGSNY
jgi:hypothetical protein